MQYPVLIKANGDHFSATVPDLGIVAIATTRFRALQLVSNGVRQHLDALESFGFPSPAPSTIPLSHEN